MNDSLLYHLNVLILSDTVITKDTVSDTIAINMQEIVRFVQINNVNIAPKLIASNTNFDIFTYIIFFLLGVIAIIWYKIPERFFTIYSLKSASKIQRDRDGDSISKKPGFFFTGLFWLIFIISLSIFSILILNEYYAIEILKIQGFQIFKLTITSIIGLFVYRFILSYWTAFFFQTQNLLKLQVIIDRNTQFITGILLLPISLLILYTNVGFIFYIVITAFVILQAHRIVQIAIIGNSSAVFSAFHIILYLCALEIVPILVLLRLINNDLGI